MPKPSQILLADVPLCGTMGHAEREFAAALIVRACQALGDEWQPVTWEQIISVCKADQEDKAEPIASLIRNPFFRPDVWDLVKEGFARWTGEPGSGPVELTEKGIGALQRWAIEEPAPTPQTGEGA